MSQDRQKAQQDTCCDDEQSPIVRMVDNSSECSDFNGSEATELPIVKLTFPTKLPGENLDNAIEALLVQKKHLIDIGGL